ncbi:MAG: hypothetical protein M3Q99_14490 [Acidobacteriota bacterium]|nr:hypothetical protein [Acidobacteriota bacterium]
MNAFIKQNKISRIKIYKLTTIYKYFQLRFAQTAQSDSVLSDKIVENIPANQIFEKETKPVELKNAESIKNPHFGCGHYPFSC